MTKLYLGTQPITFSSFNSGYGIKKVISNGNIDHGSGVINFSGVRDIGEGVLRNAYKNDSNIVSSIDMSNIETLSYPYACFQTFQNCTGITSVDLSNLESVYGLSACSSMFNGCTSILFVDMSSLETIKGVTYDANEYGFCNGMFGGCTSLEEVDLSSLKVVCARSGCNDMFKGCTNLTTIDLSNLSVVLDQYGCYGMLQGCTSLETLDLGKLTIANSLAREGTSGRHGLGCYQFAQNCTNLEEVDLHNLTAILDSDFQSAFSGCTSLESVDLSNLVSIQQFSGLSNTFENCTSLQSIHLDSLCYASRLGGTFSGCTSLTDIYLSSLYAVGDYQGFYNIVKNIDGCTIHLPTNLDPTGPSPTYDITTLSGYPNFGGTNTVLEFDQTFSATKDIDFSHLDQTAADLLLAKYQGLWRAFYNCRNIRSADLSSFYNITGNYACQYMFQNCTGLTSIDLSNLRTITGNNACQYMFYSCTGLTSISFPALTSASFGSNTNQFSQLVYGCTGVTLHFPSNLQSTISQLSGYPDFGGTNTTLLFDLPATE